MLSTVFFNQSLNSTLIEALMVSTSNYEMRGSLFLGIDASFNLKFRIALKRNNKVGQALRQCAMTLSRTKDALGAYYRRVKSRTGGIQANVATAHRLAVIIYNMIKNKTEYDESKVSKPSLTMLEKRRTRLLTSLRKLDESIAAIA